MRRWWSRCSHATNKFGTTGWLFEEIRNAGWGRGYELFSWFFIGFLYFFQTFLFLRCMYHMVIEFSCLSNKDGEAISHQREGVGLCDKSFDSLLFASSEDPSGSPKFLQPSKGGRSSSDLGFTQRVALRPVGHHFSRISTHGSWTGGKFDRIRHWEETTKFQETQGEVGDWWAAKSSVDMM